MLLTNKSAVYLTEHFNACRPNMEHYKLAVPHEIGRGRVVCVVRSQVQLRYHMFTEDSIHIGVVQESPRSQTKQRKGHCLLIGPRWLLRKPLSLFAARPTTQYTIPARVHIMIFTVLLCGRLYPSVDETCSLRTSPLSCMAFHLASFCRLNSCSTSASTSSSLLAA